MWISGSPGVGKSAVASTLVTNLTERRRLAAYFFFRRDEANLGDPATLWRTVAYDLARFHPPVKFAMAEFLKRPGFRDSDILLHFRCLIEDILKKFSDDLSETPPVIVIDALDECGIDDSNSPQRRILLDTLNHWSDIPRSFKLIVTSRNDRIPESFHDPQICYKVVLETGDSVTNEAKVDIRHFVEHWLKSIRPAFGLPFTWPGERAMDQLVERAAGLFIWAKTAMEFIGEKWGDPDDKLKLVLAGNLGEHSKNIDKLYQDILQFSFADANKSTLALFKDVVGAIIVAKVPLHRDDLKYLPDELDDKSNRQLSSILYHLSSVIDFVGTLRIRHLSFAEFMCDPNRCCDRRFVIDPRKQHLDLALASLRVMTTELRFNICGLESSYFRNDDVEDLQSRISVSIPTHLAYSCRFWADHLSSLTVTDKNTLQLLLEGTRTLFYVNLLYWLEAMSLLKAIPASNTALVTASKWLRVSFIIILWKIYVFI